MHVRRIMEDAREAIAGRFGGRPQDLVFTSGGTEADATGDPRDVPRDAAF